MVLGKLHYGNPIAHEAHNQSTLQLHNYEYTISV